MTILLITDESLSNKTEFEWLFNEVLASVGHNVIYNIDQNYNGIIYYGSEKGLKTIVTSLKSVPILLIPKIKPKYKEVKLAKTFYGEVLIDSTIKADTIFKRHENYTCLILDLTQFLFFYLSEEEYLTNKDRDKFGRLTFNLSNKEAIELEKPTLNMWAAWLDKWIESEASNLESPYFKKFIWPNEAKVALSFSHDVDIVNRSFYKYWKTFFFYVLNRETSIQNLMLSFVKHLYLKVSGKESNFNNYQLKRIRKFHTKNNIKATFNIIGSKAAGLDNENYLEMVKEDLTELVKEGHEIGLHGGYQSRSFEDEKIFELEKKTVDELVNTSISSTRQHYLGFKHDTTFLIHEKSGISYDSSIAYPDKAGYKSGFCSPYQPWVFKDRRKSKIYELPLILMDGTIFSKAYSNINLEDSKEKFKYFFHTVCKYNGVLTINWHQRIFSEGPYKKWMKLYYFILKYTKDKQIYIDTQKNIIDHYIAVKSVNIELKENNSIIIRSKQSLESFSFKLCYPKHMKLQTKPNVLIKEFKDYKIIKINELIQNEDVELKFNV